MQSSIENLMPLGQYYHAIQRLRKYKYMQIVLSKPIIISFFGETTIIFYLEIFVY